MIFKEIITVEEANLLKDSFFSSPYSEKDEQAGDISIRDLDTSMDFLYKFNELLCEKLEKNLVPVNTFMRLYKKGDDLPVHTDREELDVTLSIQIDKSEDDFINPLIVHYGDFNIEILLENRDGGIILYGNDIPHSRPPLESEWMLCLFLHYTQLR